jgi:hypothetical protein
LGCKVEIKSNARGKGKLVLHFQNHEEFDHLRNQLTDALNASRRAATAALIFATIAVDSITDLPVRCPHRAARQACPRRHRERLDPTD